MAQFLDRQLTKSLTDKLMMIVKIEENLTIDDRTTIISPLKNKFQCAFP